MTPVRPRVISVRSGQVRPTGSWLYVWLDTATGEIVHIGGTGVDPELRAHLHLTSDDAQLGRVRATVPHALERDFDVLAFELAEGVGRARAQAALDSRLSQGDDAGRLADDLSEIIDPLARAISDYRANLSTTT
ncbi:MULTISPECIES: hypothetical protein [unclassified Microbacterium]|uniref:hypothetical protein n=1 Tax=unclassified Microbacterium TaxID=2609290 RepID=UPI0034678A1F